MWCGWTFGGRVRIIFASWVNFNRAIISKRQLSVDDGLQIQKNQHIKHDFLSELFSNEDTKKVGRHLRHSDMYFISTFLVALKLAFGNRNIRSDIAMHDRNFDIYFVCSFHFISFHHRNIRTWCIRYQNLSQIHFGNKIHIIIASRYVLSPWVTPIVSCKF